MCLKIDGTLTDEIGSFLGKKKKIRCWKIFQITSSRTYAKPYSKKVLSSPIYFHCWRAGWNKALGKHNGSTEVDGGAIHVFLTREGARNYKKLLMGTNFKIVPVTCYAGDFVAAGYVRANFAVNRQAAFTKVWMDETDYDKAKPK